MVHQPNPKERRRFEHRLVLSKRAFAMGRYVVAHRLLALALDSAEVLHDPTCLRMVETCALVQVHWLERHSSPYGDPLLFRTLATEARQRRARLHRAQPGRTPKHEGGYR